MLTETEMGKIVLPWLTTNIPQDFLATLQEHLHKEMPKTIEKLLGSDVIARGDTSSFKGYFQHFSLRNIFQKIAESFGKLKREAEPSDIPLAQFDDVSLSIVRIGPYGFNAKESKKRKTEAVKNNDLISLRQGVFPFMTEERGIEDCLAKIKANPCKLFALIEVHYSKQTSNPSIYLSIPYAEKDGYLCSFRVEQVIEFYDVVGDNGKQVDKATPKLKKLVSDIQKNKDER